MGLEGIVHCISNWFQSCVWRVHTFPRLLLFGGTVLALSVRQIRKLLYRAILYRRAIRLNNKKLNFDLIRFLFQVRRFLSRALCLSRWFSVLRAALFVSSVSSFVALDCNERIVCLRLD